MIKILLLLTSLCFTCENEKIIASFAEDIAFVESSNNVHAIGLDGERGIYQITREVVIDVNDNYGTQYSHADMHDQYKAFDVLVKYLTMGCERYWLHQGKIPTKREYLIMWNQGIYRPINDNSCRPYIQRYVDLGFL